MIAGGRMFERGDNGGCVWARGRSGMSVILCGQKWSVETKGKLQGMCENGDDIAANIQK